MFKPFSCFSERRSLDSKCREAQQSYLSVHASKPPDPRLKAAVSVRIYWVLNCESDFKGLGIERAITNELKIVWHIIVFIMSIMSHKKF